MKPVLSICIPSRNRQHYCQITIADLMRHAPDDVEFIVADNSDDPAPMREAMARYASDERVRFLPSEEAILSMRDNWERAVSSSTGEWVCVIGDDDYVDPAISALVKRLAHEEPDLDVLAWQRVNFNWPDARESLGQLVVPLNSNVYRIPRDELLKHYFGWSHCSHGPTMPFSVYHSAVSRRLLQKIRTSYGDRYFEHQSVDYDNFGKVAVNGEKFLFSMRPLSITGTCAKANSAGLNNLKAFNEIKSRTIAETGMNFDEDPIYANFPFSFHLGVPAIAARWQIWYKKTYGFRYDGWERNFVEGCRAFCLRTLERDMFDQLVAGFSNAFARWKGGRYAVLFGTPEFNSLPALPMGVHNGMLYAPEDLNGVSKPSELYDLLNQMLVPVTEIAIAGHALFTDPEAEARVEKARSALRFGRSKRAA